MKRNNKSKVLYLLVMMVSILLLILSSLFLFNCMIEYKYNIDQNFDQGNLYYTYSSRKIELDSVMWYIKGSIFYLIFMTIFFGYLFTKKKE